VEAEGGCVRSKTRRVRNRTMRRDFLSFLIVRSYRKWRGAHGGGTMIRWAGYIPQYLEGRGHMLAERERFVVSSPDKDRLPARLSIFTEGLMRYDRVRCGRVRRGLDGRHWLRVPKARLGSFTASLTSGNCGLSVPYCLAYNTRSDSDESPRTRQPKQGDMVIGRSICTAFLFTDVPADHHL